ncbi:MAG: 2-amino-4-hydroxy-6-hydroxymethyldihydropteridine diphosphokinase [Kiritimatiellae bacterium]|nr:2-amino-4-hydroxy-6-hydroxymethyldihydropteridine diphosphokinase [Kiritimatiellia bacterium]
MVQADLPCRMTAHEAALSLGSNLGDRWQWLKQACSLIDCHPDVRITASSPVYETEPCGAPDAFAGLNYLNMVVVVATDLPPLVLSEAIHAIESRMGRRRSVLPNLPRNIDIDIICFGELTMNTHALILPHPRAHLRRFVLQPLSDLLPHLLLPGQSRSVTELLNGLPETPQVKRLN